MMINETLYTAMLIIEFSLAVPVFVLLFFVRAPYGKFMKKGWGPCIDARAAWALMESPAVFLPVIHFIGSGNHSSGYFIICLCLWLLHYTQRTFVYPFLLNSNTRRVPIAIIVFALVFNLLNGWINGYGIYRIQPSDPEWMLSPLMIMGIVLFLAGFVINLQSDYILRHLRSPGEKAYKIPEKGLFTLVSSPHYFGEILEWCGWLLVTRSPAAAAFLLFTSANLIPRAVTTHVWYRKQFPGYPRNRKAIFPYIL